MSKTLKQIRELAHATLGSYIKKAGDDMEHQRELEQDSKQKYAPWAERYHRKIAKRRSKGIAQAIQKHWRPH